MDSSKTYYVCTALSRLSFRASLRPYLDSISAAIEAAHMRPKGVNWLKNADLPHRLCLSAYELTIFLDTRKANLVKGCQKRLVCGPAEFPLRSPRLPMAAQVVWFANKGSCQTGNFSPVVNRDKVTEMGQISKTNCQFSSGREIAFGGHKKILDTCRRRVL
jgi:hypothetical protein